MTEGQDPRLADTLPRTAILRNKQMALTFVPNDPEGTPYKARIELNQEKIEQMLSRLRTGKIRLQIGDSFRERDFIFEDGAEVFFLMEMLDRFVTQLPNPRGKTDG